MTEHISRPHMSPEEAQKTRDRLAGNVPATAALGGTTENTNPPLMTDEQKKTAAANLKARMDARREAAKAAPATGAAPTDASSASGAANPATAQGGTTTATGAKKGTKVKAATTGMRTHIPGEAPGSGPSGPMVRDAHHVNPASDHPIARGAEPTGQTKPNQNKPSTAPTASVPAPAPALASTDADVAHNRQTVGDRGFGNPIPGGNPPHAEQIVNDYGTHPHSAKGTKRTHTDDLLK